MEDNKENRQTITNDNAKKERRAAFAIEVREAKQENDKPSIAGYASVFDSPTELFQGLREQVAKGAFTQTLKNDDIRALFNHNPDYVLGRNKVGTLELGEDIHGLWFRATPPDTQWARDLLDSVRRGDIDQCSFGFMVNEEDWKFNDDNDDALRTLKDVSLFDVSVVTYPAYQDTTASVRQKRDDLIVEQERALEEARQKQIENKNRKYKLMLKEREIGING